MNNLKKLLFEIKSNIEQGHSVAIFFYDLLVKSNYDDTDELGLKYIDYTKFGFTKDNIHDALKQLEAQKEIKIIDSYNMGWWIELYSTSD